MRVLLISPNTKENAGKYNWSCPPLGCHRLASWLNTHGHFAEVYDCNIHDNFEKKIKEGWNIIGFSCLQSTLANDINQMWKAYELNPKALFIAGGIEATLNYANILDNSPVNHIILAEGENALLEIANGTPPDLVDGIISKRAKSHQLTSEDLWQYWSAIDFRKLNYEAYWQQMRSMHPDDYEAEGGDTVRLITSTHCNRGCTFCCVTQWHRFAYDKVVKPAYLSAEQLYALNMRIKDELPTMQSIYYVEDDFIQKRDRAMESFELMKDSGIRIQIQTHTSKLINDGVDKELIKRIADGGCKHITMGVENCSDNVLKSLHKPQRIGLVSDIILECKKNDIRPYLLIILFCPEATIADLKYNVKILNSWIELGATISIEPNIMAYRGAPLYASGYEMLYDTTKLDNGNFLRYPIRILPKDQDVRKVQVLFNKHWNTYLESKKVKHQFKGHTGKLMIEFLGMILDDNKYKIIDLP